jgi:hypothetical protein
MHMKPKIFLAAWLLVFSGVNGHTQSDNTENEDRRIRFCLARIILMNKETQDYALYKMSADSMYVFPLAERGNKKEILLQDLKGIKAAEIKKVLLKPDRKIVLPDSVVEKRNETTGFTDTVISTIKTNHLKNELLGLGAAMAVNQVVFNYFESPGLIFTGSLIGIIAGPRGQIFYIQGDVEKFTRMVNKLTRMRERNNENKL